MINLVKRKTTTYIARSATCDVCGKTYDNDMDLQEFQHIDFVGGYSSVFEDMLHVRCDICQNCLKKMIGPYCYYEAANGKWNKYDEGN